MPSSKSLTMLVRCVVIAGVAITALVALLGASVASSVDVPTLLICALAFYIGETAILHVRFGRDHRTFTWSETATVISLVALPTPWMVIAAPIGVAVAHLLKRRPLTKVAFNWGSCVIGSSAAVLVVEATSGGRDGVGLAMPIGWPSLGLAALAYFLVTTTLVSAAVAFSQGAPFREIHRKDLPLNGVVCLGNTAIGIIVVATALDQPALLFLFPVLVAVAVGLYRSYLRAIQERDTWESLHAASRELLEVGPDSLTDVVLDRTRELFKADVVELVLASGGEPIARHRVGPNGRIDEENADPDELAGPYWQRVIIEREVWELGSANAPAAARHAMAAEGVGLSLVAPLLRHDQCIGLLRVGLADPVRLTQRERRAFATFANSVSAAVQNAQLFDELRRQALHDPLTGLPNRTLLLDSLRQALSRARRRGTKLALLFLDLDRFKVVNDSLGHAVGDRLLVDVADRIMQVIRPGDTATRFGGDEFVVLCEDVTDERDARSVAERMNEALRAPFQIAGQDVFLTSSVGVAVSGDVDDPHALLRDADAAMYRAKDRGRARCEVFDQDLRASLVARMETEQDLRRGLERGEFELHYQPTVDLTTQAVVGVEALVRWRRGGAADVTMPGEFVPLAEETGLILPLGRWVLDEACRQLAIWLRVDDLVHPAFTMAVNISALQLTSAGFVEELYAVIAKHAVPAHRVCLEITESALLDDIDTAFVVLHRLRAIGIRLALDDFGTGFSSLSYLHQLPVNVVKVDRSFVSRLGVDERDRAVLAGMVDLAQALDLMVVAEGVETPGQVAELQLLGCDVAQGYYFARPAPAHVVESLLVHRPIEVG